MSRRNKGLLAGGIAIALAVALLSPLASGSPDGLERVAEDNSFLEHAEDPGYEILPDYTIPGVDNEALSTILSGFVGVIAVAALALGAGMLLRWRRAGAGDDADTSEDASRRPGARV